MRYLVAYLIGAIPFSQLAMWGTGINLLSAGSRNPGFNNVLRVGGGKWRAALALAGDLLKGTFALWLLSRPTDPAWVPWGLGLAAIAGHCWTPFLKLRGGKGVATMAGALLYLEPRLVLLGAILYTLLRWFGRRRGWSQEGAISSLACAAVVTGAILYLREPLVGVLCLTLLLIVVLRHASNIREIVGMTNVE